MIAAAKQALLLVHRGHSWPALIAIWMATLGMFLWVSSVNLWVYVLSTPSLTVSGKLGLLLSVFPNFAATLPAPLPLSILAFSLVAALNFLLIFRVIQGRSRHSLAAQGGSAALVAVGSHCITCGGSLLVAPLVSLLAGSGDYLSASRSLAAQSLALAVNVVGIIILLRSMRGLVRETGVPQAAPRKP